METWSSGSRRPPVGRRRAGKSPFGVDDFSTSSASRSTNPLAPSDAQPNIGLGQGSPGLFAPLLPLGILQLYESVNDGYFAARQLKFITNPSNSLLEWMRLPGDVVFIVGGALPFLRICWLGVRRRG